MKTRYAANIVLMSASGDVAVEGFVVAGSRGTARGGDFPALREAGQEDDVVVQGDAGVMAVDVDLPDRGLSRKVLIGEGVRARLLCGLLNRLPGMPRQQFARLGRVTGRQPSKRLLPGPPDQPPDRCNPPPEHSARQRPPCCLHPRGNADGAASEARSTPTTRPAKQPAATPTSTRTGSKRRRARHSHTRRSAGVPHRELRPSCSHPSSLLHTRPGRCWPGSGGQVMRQTADGPASRTPHPPGQQR
jgi:hypothetical protein